MEIGKAWPVAKCQREHFRTQARSSHPEKQCVIELSRLDVLSDPIERVRTGKSLFGNAQPAEPFGFARSSPERGVTPPQLLHSAVFLPVVDYGIDLRLNIAWKVT